jgi:DNA-3-methyladenine glycosylase
MWGAPGMAYVYQIYGAHFCFNAVCQVKGVAEAVLVRTIEPTFGQETMQQFRTTKSPRDLTNGPLSFVPPSTSIEYSMAAIFATPVRRSSLRATRSETKP